MVTKRISLPKKYPPEAKAIHYYGGPMWTCGGNAKGVHAFTDVLANVTCGRCKQKLANKKYGDQTLGDTIVRCFKRGDGVAGLAYRFKLSSLEIQAFIREAL